MSAIDPRPSLAGGESPFAAERWGATSDAFGRLLPRVAWALLAAAFLVALHAAIERRALVADGAAYLLWMLRAPGEFAFLEPSRRVVHFLQELPTVLALRLGLRNLAGIQILYGLTLHLLPLGLTALCWSILPKHRKLLFFFPVLHYLAGTQMGAFFPLAEGATAAAYFWVLFLLLLFGRETAPAMAAMLLLTLPTPYLHEAMVFLGPVLAFAAIWRARYPASPAGAAAFVVIALCAFIAAAVQLGFILHPRSTENRASFIGGLLDLRWLKHNGASEISVVALFIMLVGGALALLGRDRIARRLAPGAVVALALVGIVILLAAVTQPVISPRAQFAARNNAALLSFPLAVLVLLDLVRPRWRAAWARPANLAILGCLGVGVLSWQLMATWRWSQYLDTVTRLTASRPGTLAWEDALAAIPDRPERRRFERMSWSWAMPALSLQMTKDRQVIGVIAPRTGGGSDRTFPVADYPFFDGSIYRAAVEKAAP